MSLQRDMNDNPVATPAIDVRGQLAATVFHVDPDDSRADAVEIRVNTAGNAGGKVRLSQVEVKVFALLLSKLVDEFEVRSGAGEAPEAARSEGGSITRDALLQALLLLPREAEIDVQIGNDHIGIVGLEPAWEPTQGWFALRCNQADVVSAGLTAQGKWTGAAATRGSAVLRSA